jgi:hypothetical protein
MIVSMERGDGGGTAIVSGGGLVGGGRGAFVAGCVGDLGLIDGLAG